MTDLIVACVRTGTAYGMEYVVRLRNMVARHLARQHSIICLTDQEDRCEGVAFIDISQIGLTGWWAKLTLFAPEWRDTRKVVYLDLDTVVIDSLLPLANVAGEFAITENYTRKAVNPAYPCKYNSSVMVIGGGQTSFVWRRFEAKRAEILSRHARYGDQAAIEELYPAAPYLQMLLPAEYFCNYRNLTNHPPKRAAIINFGGRHKPHNCLIPWVQQAWS